MNRPEKLNLSIFINLEEAAPLLVSSTDTKGTKLYTFIFCIVLFPVLTIVGGNWENIAARILFNFGLRAG
jgi:hypothetical protein